MGRETNWEESQIGGFCIGIQVGKEEGEVEQEKYARTKRLLFPPLVDAEDWL